MSEKLRGVSKGSLVIRIAVALLVMAVIGMGVRSKFRKKTVEQVEEAPERVVDVRTMVVAVRQLADTVQLPGVLEPRQDVHVANEKPGRIVEMAVELGDSVKQGDLLWRVNDDTRAAVVKRAEVEAAEAEKEWKRLESLRESGAVSIRDLGAARRARDIADAARAEAVAHMAKCTIRSPIDGTVEERFADLGEHPAEGQVVLRVVDTRRLKLVVDVPEQDVLSMSLGDPVSFVLSSLSGRTFEGPVTFVSEVGRPGSNVFNVEIEVDNAAGELKAGMIASARLVRSARDGVIAVPLSAVVPEKGEHVVFVVEEGHAVRRTVQLHAIQDQFAVLEGGLREGETLVVEGQRGLQDGRQVKEDATE